MKRHVIKNQAFGSNRYGVLREWNGIFALFAEFYTDILLPDVP